MVQPLRVALASLVLNEEEFLPHNWVQHQNWPGMVAWVFVEGADRKYAEANPKLVTNGGLSTDKTSEYVAELSMTNSRVRYIQQGWMDDPNQAQSKTRGRDRYLEVFEELQPDIFVVIDADEFYTQKDQAAINRLVRDQPEYLCWRFRQRHLWHPPSLGGHEDRNRFRFEVLGGYWSVPHVRVFRWQSGIRYCTDHNWPRSKQYRPLSRLYNAGAAGPTCIHLGFTRSATTRAATHRYYEARGEGAGDGRERYVACRAAWETWEPGQRLPSGAYVAPYTGQKPEAYT